MYQNINLTEELQNYDNLLDEMNGGGWSAHLGNEGSFCSITVECMIVCTWF
jgi:hypothetical protein